MIVFLFFVYSFLVLWNFIIFMLVSWGLIRMLGGLLVKCECVMWVWSILSELFIMFIIFGGFCLFILVGILVNFFFIFLIILEVMFFLVFILLVEMLFFLFFFFRVLFFLLLGENYWCSMFWFFVKKFLVLCWFFLWFCFNFLRWSGWKLVLRLIVIIKLVFNWWYKFIGIGFIMVLFIN